MKNARNNYSGSISQNPGGFTVLELLVAIMIAGILFTLGLVSFRRFSRQQLLISAARQLKNDLRTAQNSANIGRKVVNEDCTCFSPIDNKCRTPSENASLEGWKVNLTSQTTYRLEAMCAGGLVNTNTYITKDLPQGVQMTTIPAVPTSVLFKVLNRGTDLDSATSLVIQLALPGDSNINPVQIEVYASGEIR